jgi:hypothetical protein
VTTSSPLRAPRTTRHHRLVLVLLTAAFVAGGQVQALAASPSPGATPGVPTNTPSHGRWLEVVIVLAFLALGAGTLLLAHLRSRPPAE